MAVDFKKALKNSRSYRAAKKDLLVRAEFTLVLAEQAKKSEEEIDNLHEIIRKIIHVGN